MTAVAAGSGNSSLTASNIVITEDGAAGANNWATYTTQVVGSASDTNSTGTPGTITVSRLDQSGGNGKIPVTSPGQVAVGLGTNTPRDGLVVTASLASYVSAMRGTSVDPTTVLRGD